MLLVRRGPPAGAAATSLLSGGASAGWLGDSGLVALSWLCPGLARCYLGWLWPIWDAKRQAFADKIVSIVVPPA